MANAKSTQVTDGLTSLPLAGTTGTGGGRGAPSETQSDIFSEDSDCHHILNSLHPRRARVILEMDVSYKDHQPIIGIGGNKINEIMEDSNTHIHFPDSNLESNQVFLCGSLEGVERARAMVRPSTSLLISFELPVSRRGKTQPHLASYIQMIAINYNVKMMMYKRPKLHLVVVKGSERESVQVRDATQLLIDFVFESIANQILVSLQMQISPQHHEIVKGKNNVNLLSIMECTQTKIIFPDLTDMNVHPLKKFKVLIIGRIDDVYRARKQLLGNFPVVLIFSLSENRIDASEILSLNIKYGVCITLRQNSRQTTLTVIKGIEK